MRRKGRNGRCYCQVRRVEVLPCNCGPLRRTQGGVADLGCAAGAPFTGVRRSPTNSCLSRVGLAPRPRRDGGFHARRPHSRGGRSPPTAPGRRAGVGLTITDIIVSLTSRVFETARAAGRGNNRTAGAGDGRSWYVVVSGELMRAEDRADGGHRGGVPIGGGAVFQCRTLEWVVGNIPQKICPSRVTPRAMMISSSAKLLPSRNSATRSYPSRDRSWNSASFRAVPFT